MYSTHRVKFLYVIGVSIAATTEDEMRVTRTRTSPRKQLHLQGKEVTNPEGRIYAGTHGV